MIIEPGRSSLNHRGVNFVTRIGIVTGVEIPILGIAEEGVAIEIGGGGGFVGGSVEVDFDGIGGESMS